MPFDQLRGTVQNILEFLSFASLEELVPPAVYSSLVWIRDTIPRGLGFSDRRGHITGIVGLTVVMIVASLTILTAVAIVYFVIAMAIAVTRFIPAVDDRWPFSASAWPFWEVQ